MTDDLLSFANHASAQNDRWLFVCLLLICLVFAWVLFRYLIRQIDQLRSRMDEQSAEFVAHLKQANKEMLEVVATSAKTIAQNSAIMERVERKLDHQP